MALQFPIGSYVQSILSYDEKCATKGFQKKVKRFDLIVLPVPDQVVEVLKVT